MRDGLVRFSLSVCVTDFSQKSYLLCISFGDSSNIPFEYKYMQCTFACVTCKYQSTNLGTNKSNKFLRIMCQSWEKINSTKEKKCFNSYPFTRKTKAIFFQWIYRWWAKWFFLSLSLWIWLLRMLLSAFYPWRRRECCLSVSCFISIASSFVIVTSIQVLRLFVR